MAILAKGLEWTKDGAYLLLQTCACVLYGEIMGSNPPRAGREVRTVVGGSGDKRTCRSAGDA
ncbi:MAG: hypothetical protein NVSMB42_00110 [Herpetosiphon sp.]